MGHGNQKPEIELARAFMPVLITSNFDDESIKNERDSMEHGYSIFPLKVYGKFVRCLRAANSVVSGPIWQKFELMKTFIRTKVGHTT